MIQITLRRIFIVVQADLPCFSTWSHKNLYLCALFSEAVFTYLTARFATISKRNVHWVALKHRFNTWTLAHFITLLQERIAADQNSNIQGPSLKSECSIVLEICPTPNPTLNLPNSVDKCKTEIKTYLLMPPFYLNFPICRFELFGRTVVTRDSNLSSMSTPWATDQTYRQWKHIDMKLDMCDANVQKHQFSNLPAY